MYMCLYRKVEDRLPVCLKTKTASCIPKNKLKLCICVWASMTWLRALESTLPFKTASCNSWDTAQLFKMLCDNAPLTVHQLGHNIVSPKFSAALSFLKILEAPSFFGEYFFFFSYDFKNIEHLITFVNSNAASREPLIIFERDRANMSNRLNLVYARCYSSLSTNHVGMPHQALI